MSCNKMLECLLKSLIANPFSTRSYIEKNNIISAGRPTPELPNLTQQSPKFIRHFQSNLYEKCQWLTGSAELNALFCWNCLLFGKERDTSWTKTGYTNLGNLSNSINRHEVTIHHLRATLCLANFVQSRIEFALDNQLDAEIALHNQKVKRNREILTRLVDAVCFLAKQELALRGDNEKETSRNRGNYVELLNYAAKYDTFLADHLQDSTVFEVTSNRIQNDIIDACGSAVSMAIKKEIKEAKFVSVLVNKTTDVVNKSQFSIVLRYVYQDGARERFLGFSDVSKEKRAEPIVEQIRLYLTEFDCNDKLVSQAYDGYSTLTGHSKDVQAKIKNTHSMAVLVHSYAHPITLVLIQSVSQIPESKIFFSILNSIAGFFSGSPKRTKFLDEFLQKRLPKVHPSRWNYSSRLVKTLCQNRSQFIDIFNIMLACPNEIDADTLAPVKGFLCSLEDDFQFNFLLKTFDKIFEITDVLCDILQHQLSDILRCCQKIREVQQNFAALHDGFENVYEETKELVGEPFKHGDTNYEHIYHEVVDNIVNHVETRFQDYGKLKFLNLLSHKKYQAYQQGFPENLLKNLLDTYGQCFEEARLKNELTALYSSEEFSDKTVPDLAKFLGENAIFRTCFPQLNLLVSLLFTIPVCAVSEESSFSTLERIKSYCRNSTEEERLSFRSLLSIESDFVTQLKSNNQFYEDVIKNFCDRECGMEFLYR